MVDVINSTGAQNITNLATSLCGWPAVLSLLFITESMPDIKVLHIDYQNSGDETRDKSRVVGYNAIAFTKKNTQHMAENKFTLSDKEKEGIAENCTQYNRNLFARQAKCQK
ncbi:MAG: AmmeMemoRadiSam system protein B [Marinilabiliales bacterium]|nr:AmmeMemoRadiSam system protein B [Marinilabiliales bacterium]